MEEFVRKASQPPVSVIQERDHQTLTSHPPSATTETDTMQETDSMQETEVVKKPVHTLAAEPAQLKKDTANQAIDTSQSRDTHNFSRLPKLTLPTFNGSALQWQTFWDSFTAGVDSNPNLSNIQKFAYLRAQLEGDAARVISGFPLTDRNYVESVAVLKERFGQQFKLVDAHMEALLNVPAPSNNLSSLQSFYDTIQSHTRSLSALGTSSDSYGTLLTTVILNKLPADTKARMAQDHYNTEWNINELMSSILKEIHVFEAGQHSGRKTHPISTTSSFHMTTNKGMTRERPKKEPTCVFCKGMHRPNQCTTISSPKECLTIIKNAGLCFNCLARHRVSQCTSKFTCRDCHKKHHTSLFHAFTTNIEPPSQMPPVTPVHTVPQTVTTAAHTVPQATTTVTQTVPQNTTTASHTVTARTHNEAADTTSLSALSTSVCLLKTAIANVSAGETTVEGHILFDEGAQRSFITQELANQLQLQPSKHENISVSSFGEQVSTSRRLAIASVLIETLHNGHIPISALIVPKLAALIRNSVRTHLDKLPYLQELPLAHPVTSDENFHISILIGADYYWQFIQDRIIRGNGPTAVQSRLGYLLSGPLPLPQSAYITCTQVLTFSCITEDTDCDNFWKMESIGTTPMKQITDTDFLQEFLNNNITLQSDSTYCLKFPWKTNHPALPSNYIICAKRTRSMIYRLAKTPHLLRIYGNIIEEQERKGFIERVDERSTSNSVHYIPHHPVRKESSTTPIRIVYDCSCKPSPNTPSLNDCLNSGPPFLNDLCSILLRFRLHNFTFSADIEKAFLHVHLDEADRDFTRFLWLSNPSDPTSPFVTFRFKVVLFGATCSPFMLNATIHHHLNQNNSSTSRDLLCNIYVDNVVSGSCNEEAAVEYFKQSRSILGSASFNLRSWASNSTQLNSVALARNVADSTNPV